MVSDFYKPSDASHISIPAVIAFFWIKPLPFFASCENGLVNKDENTVVFVWTGWMLLDAMLG